MADPDHVERVKKLAASAMAWEAQDSSPPKVCTCRTCGVVNARIRGALSARGWPHSATHHVHIEGFDFRGGCDPYLAVVKVDGNEIHRAYEDLSELLDSSVLDRVEKALRRQVC